MPARKRSTSAPKKSPGKNAPARAFNLSEKYRVLFESIDLDKNGTIEPSELIYALPDLKLTPHRIDIMFQEADLDGNGRLDLEEFSKVMEKSKDTLDAWGMASKSLWGKFWHNIKDQTMQTVEVVDSAIEPLHTLSRRHSSVVTHVTGRHSLAPSVGLRLMAHAIALPILIFFNISAFLLCMAPAFSKAVSIASHPTIQYCMQHSGECSPETIYKIIEQEGILLLLVFGCILSFVLNFLFVIIPMSRGQTVGHYLFGMQMVNATTGENCGFLMVLLKYIIANGINTFISVYFKIPIMIYSIVDLFVLVAGRRSLTDQLLGVRVVTR